MQLVLVTAKQRTFPPRQKLANIKMSFMPCCTRDSESPVKHGVDAFSSFEYFHGNVHAEKVKTLPPAVDMYTPQQCSRGCWTFVLCQGGVLSTQLRA